MPGIIMPDSPIPELTTNTGNAQGKDADGEDARTVLLKALQADCDSVRATLVTTISRRLTNSQTKGDEVAALVTGFLSVCQVQADIQKQLTP